jgi:hypothetical protein
MFSVPAGISFTYSGALIPENDQGLFEGGQVLIFIYQKRNGESIV